MSEVVAVSSAGSDQSWSADDQMEAMRALESGNVLFFPHLRFLIQSGEERILSPVTAMNEKNISLDPASGVLRGSKAGAADAELLRTVMTRFGQITDALVRKLLPRYEPELQQGRTSFRPAEIAGRPASWRTDDTRLHVDSFPASPLQGRRILRVFANVNPEGRPRTWRLGEGFEDVARRYIRTLPKPIPGLSRCLEWLRVTNSRRSAYDHYMLQLHDRMKADSSYQSAATQRLWEFPAGSTWIAFTDQVSHGAVSGQYALEQTFHLPVHSMLDPSRSPLRILELLLGRTLAPVT